MLILSQIPNYKNQEGAWKVGTSVKQTVRYDSLKEFYTKYPIESVPDKYAGMSLAPYRCFGAPDLIKMQEAADTALGAGKNIRWDVTGEQDKTYRLYKDEKLVWQCHLNRFEKPRRLDLNIATYGSMILDFDEYGETETTLRSRIDLAIASTGWAAVVQSSFNHGVYKEGRGVKQAFHVFLELDRVVKKDEWLALFASVEDAFAQHGAVVDGVTTDFSRLYFGVCKNTTNGASGWAWDYVHGGLVETDPLIMAGSALVSNREYKKKETAKYTAAKNGIVMEEGVNSLAKIKWSAFDTEMVFDALGITYGDIKPTRAGSEHEWTFRFHCTESHGGADDAVCAFTPGGVPMIYCAHNSCVVGKGEGSTKRFFARHWASLPAEVVDEEVAVLKRKVKTKPKATPVKSSGSDNDVVISDGVIFEGELDLGQAKYTDILDVFHLSQKSILVTAPTGAGKSTANLAYGVECVSKGKHVLYVCSTKAEMGQFKESMEKKASAEMNSVTFYHSAEHTKIPEDTMMIVTHHHYLIRAGIMDVYYPVVDWAVDAVVIIDEVDALMSQMAKTMPISARTTKFKDGYTHYQSTCPSRTARRYQCDDCTACSRMPMVAFAQRIWNIELPKYPVSDYEMGNPVACYPTQYQGFSNIIGARNVFESKTHELKLSTLGRPDTHVATHVLDPMAKVTHLSAMGWINTIIAESNDPTLVQTNEDLAHTFQEAFAKYKAEYTPGGGEDEATRAKNAVSYANSQINKMQRADKLQHYPMHACGTKELHWIDTFVLKLVISRAEQVRYTTGTMSERKRRVLDGIHGKEDDVVYIDIKNTSYVPIDHLTLVLVEDTLTNKETAEMFASRKVMPTLSSHGMKIEKSLVITPTIAANKALGAHMPGAALYDHEVQRACVGESYHGAKWDVMGAPSRSPVTRGMDLGDFSSCTIDSSVYKPMYSYDFSEAFDLESVQQEERNSFISQGAGRILRRAMHPIDGVWTQIPDSDIPWGHQRCVLIHGVEDMVAAQQRLVGAWKNLVANPINVIVVDAKRNLEDVDNIDRVVHVMDQFWNHIAVPEGRVFEIAQKYYEVPYARACRMSPKFANFVSAEDHERIYQEMKSIEKFKEHVEKFANLNSRDKQKSISWHKLSPRLTTRVRTLYERWFGGEEGAGHLLEDCPAPTTGAGHLLEDCPAPTTGAGGGLE